MYCFMPSAIHGYAFKAAQSVFSADFKIIYCLRYA